MQTLKLVIDGMHCHACVNRVTQALTRLDSVRPVTVVVGSAELSYDPAVTNEETILAAVRKAGFEARAAN
jgi:copper chaperone CopZ